MKPRLEFLDGLRALAALTVLADHLVDLVLPRYAPGSATGRFLAIFGPAGHLAVALFLVLSGFCLMLPVVRDGELRGGWRGFWMRRARRILPPYLAALGLTVYLITQAGLPLNMAPLRASITAHLLLLHDVWTPPEGLQNPMWSLPIEWHLYWLFPLLAILMARGASAKVVSATLAAAFTLPILSTCFDAAGPHRWGIHAPPCSHFLGLFVLGMFAAVVCSVPRSPAWPGALLFGALTIAGAGATLVLVLGNRPAYVQATTDLVSGVGLVALLVNLTTRPGRLAHLLSVRPLVWIGGFSYSLYLVHFPLIRYPLIANRELFRLLKPIAAPFSTLNLILCGLIIILAAYVFHCLFERPFLTQIRRRSEDRRSAASDSSRPYPQPSTASIEP